MEYNNQPSSPSKLAWYQHLLDQSNVGTPSNLGTAANVGTAYTRKSDTNLPSLPSVQPSYRVLADVTKGASINNKPVVEDEEQNAHEMPISELNPAKIETHKPGLRRSYNVNETYQNQTVNSNQNLVPEKSANSNSGCSKWWLLLIIPLILILLAGIGVLLYFTICHWAGSCSSEK